MLPKSTLAALALTGVAVAGAPAFAETRTGYAAVNDLSMGGGVALQLAVRHPDLVRKLVIVSSGYSTAGFIPGLSELIAQLKPEDFAGSPWMNAYIAAAGSADGWPTLVRRVVDLVGTPFDWSKEVASIRAPTLVVVGDVDNFLPQHALDMFHLLGGRTVDPYGQRIPRTQLVVLPGTSHVGMLERAAWLVPMIEAFFNAPMPQAE